MADLEFAQRIKEEFPDGLTGIFVVSGTRTTYILERENMSHDVGAIDDFEAYAKFMIPQYHNLIQMFFNLGGVNMIIPLYPYQVFHARGDEYASLAIQATGLIIEDAFSQFYRANGIDPYFAGLDILERFPEGHGAFQLLQRIRAFQEQWDYQSSRRKLIWEVAPIPLYSYWNLARHSEAPSQIEEIIASSTSLDELYQTLYRHYTRMIYGVEIPMPHFYLGSNRNGELKLRSMYPISMLAGNLFRLYYIPYPTPFMKENVLKAIIEDLAFGNPLRALKKDYSGKWTAEQLQAERERILELSQDPSAVVGMTRNIETNSGNTHGNH